MNTDIVFVHTSEVHVQNFDTLISELASNVRVRHVVLSELLTEAQTLGSNHLQSVHNVQQAMLNAAQSGAKLVVCTCSTIGAAAERTVTNGKFVAARIDRAMADRAVQLGQRILIVAALESSLQPTAALIQESAEPISRTITLDYLLVEDAWERFLVGDMTDYIQVICTAISAQKKDFDIVVLAQASMAPAVPLLTELGCEVLSSPRLGVIAALKELELRGT
ncbi:MAG: Asp/Glu/hydantoin racemase [Undibacterium sp.]|nr:Asp/Glu/hydantoin racemase [Undibacterium sp.]